MGDVKDGGPAFPQHPLPTSLRGPEAGVSLRVYAAIHAPPPFDDNTPPSFAAAKSGVLIPAPTDDAATWHRFWLKADVAARYRWADEMLSARRSPEEGP